MSLVRFVSFNINSDRRLEWKDDPRFKYTAHAFSDLSIKNRFPMIRSFILNLIKQKNIPCFALQEVDSEALGLLQNLFKELNFKTYIEKYCPHKDSYHYILAVDENVIQVKSAKQIYFTESGLPTTDKEREVLTKEQKLKKHLHQEFEKSAQLAWLNVKGKDTNHQLLLVNIQAGTSSQHRLLAMQKLCEALEDINLPMILVGDFNQFDSDEKKPTLLRKQIQILMKNGFQWCTENLQEKGLRTTFFAFPHDIERFLTPEEQKELAELKGKENYIGIREFYLKTIEKDGIELSSVCLDAVYAKNHKGMKINTKSYTSLDGKLVNTEKQERKEFQKAFLNFFKQSSANSGLQVPVSDHFALLTKIEFASSEKSDENSEKLRGLIP